MSLARYLANLLNSSGQVEAAKLAASLDLSSKTLTYPDNSVQSADIASLAAAKVSGQLADSNMSPGSIIQVVQTVKSNFQSAVSNGGSWIDITDFSLSITPISNSSRIMIISRVQMHSDGNMFLRLMRNSTPIGVGDVDGIRLQASAGDGYSPDDNRNQNYSINFVDSPSTTSATTYKVQFWLENVGKTGVINGQVGNSNTVSRPRFMSTLIAMEISA